MRARFAGWILGLGLALAGARADEPAVDFEREVRPILERRCVPCHGPSESNSGLRLDQRTLAAAGGDSGRPILEGAGENELLRRVAAADELERMPPDEPLPPAEVEALRRWVEAGTPWPEEAASLAAPDSAATSSPSGAGNEPGTPWSPDALQRRFFGAWWLGGGLLLLFLLFLLGERARGRVARGEAADSWRRLARLPRATWVAGLAVLAVAGGEREHVRAFTLERARRRAAEARARELALSQGQVYGEPYGDPPQPVRPLHLEPALSRRYWRGNCERSPRLWNGGHYATALVDVSLVDGEGRPLRHGDPYPAEGAALRLDLERAPFASPRLFTRGLMQKVFLSASPVPTARPRAGAVPLEELAEQARWTARYPLPRRRARHVEHLIYLLFGKPHLAITLELHLEDDGRLAPRSTLWLGLLYWNPRVALPQPGKVPQHEFLDERPIPTIPDEAHAPVDDPELLGTGEWEDRQGE